MFTVRDFVLKVLRERGQGRNIRLRERILKYFPEALLAEKVTEANNKKLHSEIIKAFHDSGSKNTFHEFYVVEVAEQILNWKI